MEFWLEKKGTCTISVASDAPEAVQIAAANLATDVKKVLGCDCDAETCERLEPEQFIGSARLLDGNTFSPSRIVILTPESMSADWEDTLERILSDRGLSLDVIRDEAGKLQKDAYLQCVCNGSLVIVGSDRRGAIYGIYELSEMLGVSPWYFWADVPVKEKESFTLEADYCKYDFPSIEYRGIFINDEEELERWVQKYMGESTIGVKTYETIFELLLRLKANYIWPAMHVNSFNAVPENGALAHRMGIVVGTSHCDMLMRSNNREWKPWVERKEYTDAEYDYSVPGRNREILREYWRESVEQNREFEVCYTLGMRGIHDTGFVTRNLPGDTEEERMEAKVALLSQIIRDQCDILQDTLGRETMKTFIPYKEVLDLYDRGMELPEDLTLVWANDNYGHIRRFPSEKERSRKGGNGIYYHNSYWSPPSMSYVFLCSIPLAHTRNELRKAYEQGIRKLWVMNVGSMKPLEQEMTYFLRLAWEMGKENALTEDVDAYVADWIDRTFSGNIGAQTARLLNDFSQLTNVRKIENMSSDVFSQTAYGDEAAVRIHAYEALFEKGNALYDSLTEAQKDAFYQLVLMRIHAAYFTNLAYYYGDRSVLAHDGGKMQAAAFYSAKALELDDVRRKMLIYYNQKMSGGKWNGILDPEGFPPPRAAMMPVAMPPLRIGKRIMLVKVWNDEKALTFVRRRTKFIEIANGGEGLLEYEIQGPEWVKVSDAKGVIATEKRIMVEVPDCDCAKQGEIVVRNLSDQEEIVIPVSVVPFAGADAPETVAAVADGVGGPFGELTEAVPVEEDGLIVIEACNTDWEESGFRRIKRLGRGTGDLLEVPEEADTRELLGMQSTREMQDMSEASGALTYSFGLAEDAAPLLEIHRFPSLDSTGRIRIGVSVDNGEMMMAESLANDEWRSNWKDNVLNNVDRLYVQLPLLTKGYHQITLTAIDRYFAFSRLVLYTKERKENNYIGIAGDMSLPKLWDVSEWASRWYGEITLQPRPIEYANVAEEEDTLVKADWVVQETCYAPAINHENYLKNGVEKLTPAADGRIYIDAAIALAESKYAYTSGDRWGHCYSESYGRSGLAMYLRSCGYQADNGLSAVACGQETNTGESDVQERFPGLHYRFDCTEGTYTVWVLAKFNIKEEADFRLGMDGKMIPMEQTYCEGCLWRYEAEQIYRWVPLAKLALTSGEHELAFYAPVPGIRVDRMYLTTGEELPPTDCEWAGAVRNAKGSF